MGMFDNIIVNRNFALPLPEDLGELTIEDIYSFEKQTKDLDNTLSTYHLNADGSITREINKWVEEDEEDNPPLLISGKKWNIPTGHLEPTGEIELVSAPKVINFYIYTHSDNLNNDYEVEWEYTYTENSKTIKLIKFEKTCNKERKEREKKWQDEMNARHEFLNKWYMKPYCCWADFVRWIFIKYNRLKNKLPPSYKIQRWLAPL